MRIVVVYLGPAQYLGPWVCYMLMITMLHLSVNSFISIMLSMVFRCIAIRTLRFPTSAAYVMCALGYCIPLTMVLGVINMEYVSDYESNTNYMNHTVANLQHYRTVVGTRVDQVGEPSVILLASVFLQQKKGNRGQNTLTGGCRFDLRSNQCGTAVGTLKEKALLQLHNHWNRTERLEI
ncbi:hypothetical protein COOONC_24926 [Cooperia oncophora]